MAETAMVSQVGHLAAVSIMTKFRVAFESEVATLLLMEDKMAVNLRLEDKMVKIPLMVVMMVRDRLHLLLTWVVRR